MKTVVCTMCGSTDIVKKGDLFVCQHCDTKFERLEDLERKDGSGSGEASSDDPAINNYLVLAKVALDAGNLSEAEGYLKTILEKDVTQFQAWFYRGIVAVMSSTVENSRLLEAVEYIGRSFNYVPDCGPEKNKLQSDVSELFVELCQRKLNELYVKFSDSCAPEDVAGMLHQLHDVLHSLLVLKEKYGIDVQDISAEEAQRLTKVAVDAYNNVIGKNFVQLVRPNRRDWEEFTLRSNVIMSMLDASILMNNRDAEQARIRYCSKITILNNLLNACFYDADGKMYMYNVQHKAEIKQQIAECVEKINEIDKILGPQAGGKEVPTNAEAANANRTLATDLSTYTSYYVKFLGYAFLVLIPFALLSSEFVSPLITVLCNLFWAYIGMKFMEDAQNFHNYRIIYAVLFIFWLIVNILFGFMIIHDFIVPL